MSALGLLSLVFIIHFYNRDPYSPHPRPELGTRPSMISAGWGPDVFNSTDILACGRVGP